MPWSLSALRMHIWLFMTEYLYSDLSKISAFGFTGFTALSELFGIRPLLFPALLLLVVPPYVYYNKYRPFGIQITYTPMNEPQDGNPAPDKMAEDKGNAYLQNGKCTITFMTKISEKREKFDIRLETADEIQIELRDKPRNEHNITSDPLTLSGENITTREFPVVVDVYSDCNTKQLTDRYPLKIVDVKSGRCLLEITLIPQ